MNAHYLAGRRNGKQHTLDEMHQQEAELTRFIQGRNQVLLELDEKAIRAYYAEWGVPCPTEALVFWAGVHKARVQIKAMPKEEKAASIAWLAEHGFDVPEQ